MKIAIARQDQAGALNFRFGKISQFNEKFFACLQIDKSRKQKQKSPPIPSAM
jgi:hypothetical protein